MEAACVYCKAITTIPEEIAYLYMLRGSQTKPTLAVVCERCELEFADQKIWRQRTEDEIDFDRSNDAALAAVNDDYAAQVRRER